MKRVTKVLLSVPLILLIVAGAALAVLFLRFPAVGDAPSLQVERTAEQVARGEYLANHVTLCLDCHSGHDEGRYSRPPRREALGHGGDSFDHEDGFPGVVHFPNLTPTGLGAWSDGEILRAMTSGVRRDGAPLFPLMPYGVYAHLSRRDAEALIAYLRTLPPGGEVPPRSEIDFPLNLIMRTMPAPATLRETTPRAGDADYGRYLATIAACQYCHTPQEKGQPIPGMEFAGGRDFGFVRSANITPDGLTGIGGWTKEAFVARFKGFAGGAPAVGPGDPNTVMPWTLFAGMTEEDLGAIYDYLRTVPAKRHAVEKWPARDGVEMAAAR
jgi:mono/diheme cytochrome c family protein